MKKLIIFSILLAIYTPLFLNAQIKDNKVSLRINSLENGVHVEKVYSIPLPTNIEACYSLIDNICEIYNITRDGYNDTIKILSTSIEEIKVENEALKSLISEKDALMLERNNVADNIPIKPEPMIDFDFGLALGYGIIGEDIHNFKIYGLMDINKLFVSSGPVLKVKKDTGEVFIGFDFILGYWIK